MIARSVVFSLLSRIESGQLTVVEGGERHVFGAGTPQATVVVRSPARVAAALCAAGAGWPTPTSTACGTRRTSPR